MRVPWRRSAPAPAAPASPQLVAGPGQPAPGSRPTVPARRRAVAGLGAATVVAGLLVPAALGAVQLTGAAPAAALTNGLALTPQMGFNDWNAFGCNVSEKLIEQTADAMVANGMKAAGYDYVNIDDCWQEKTRDAQGDLVPDPTKFPDGIKGVADYVHGKGMKLGIYEDAGTETCAGYPGSLGHEKQDAATFASWGVDYLKYDNCNNAGSTTTQQYIDRYVAMRDALKATGRAILYSLCEWGVNDPWTWAPAVGNSWRTTGDINDSWGSMLSIFQQNVNLYPYAHQGAWNDPDMLEVGNGGMTTTEYRSEFSLWAAMNAPLIAGTDLRTISKTDLAIYTNKEVIALDQDPLGKQARPVGIGGQPAGDNGLWVLTKPLANGDRGVVLFNSTGSPATISTTARHVGLPAANDYGLRDLWKHSTTETAGTISATVPAHGVVVYRVSKGRPSGSVAPNTTVGLTGLPASPTPGSKVTVTVSLTDNGRTALKQAALTLDAPASWKARATSSTLFTHVASGQKVTARFTLTPPVSKTKPFSTATVTATGTYSFASGGSTGESSQSVSQQATTVAPVQAPNLTYSSATDGATAYGQAGDDYGISGAGSDLWTSADAYTTIYRSGVVGTTSTVQTELTSLGALSGYGKTGILVRNAMTSSGTGTEGVILFVSPSGGIQLEWNDNGGTHIDAVSPSNGTIAARTPVYLRLVRAGSTYTGYYSTDGSTWTTVASATLSGQADTQDAGLFVTSASSGLPVAVTFHGFDVTSTSGS